MPLLIAQNLTTEDVHLGDLYAKVPKPQVNPCGPDDLGILRTFRSSPELMRSPALHKAIAEGKLAIAIQFTSDEIASGFDIFPGVQVGGGGGGSDVAVLDEGISLTSAVTSIDFVGSGVRASASGSAVRVSVGVIGGEETALTSTPTLVGRACYLTSATTAELADAASFSASVVAGVYLGEVGRLSVSGVVSLQFSDVSAVPTEGKLVFLERADAEPLSAAAGKVRMAPILTAGFVVPIGIVRYVPPDYATTKMASILLSLPGTRITRVG